MWWLFVACGSQCGLGTVKVDGVCVSDAGSEDLGGPGGGTTPSSEGGPSGVDADGDGFDASLDCDDSAPDIHPGAVEVCDNGIDEDCDGVGAGCRWEGVVELESSDGVLEGSSLDVAAWVADLNGDGVPELAVGGRQEVVLYSGAAGLNQTEDQALAIIDLPLLDVGPVASGDVDGDGLPDLVVGHPDYDTSAHDRAGAITVVTGDLVSGDVQIGVTMGTFENQWLGDHLGLGDITGDGRLDLVVGSKVGLRLYAGPLSAGAPLTPAFEWPDGDGPFEIGDLNGDGADDLIALANDEVFGLFGPLTSGGSLETHEDFTLFEASNYGHPTDLTLVGDVDGDGTPDLLVAARSSDEACSACGSAYLVSGPGYTGTLAAATASIHGTLEIGTFGAFSTALGDLDQDGFADIAVSADSYSGSPAQAHVFYGPLSGSMFANTADFVIQHEQGDLFLHGGQDFTGDGVPDLFVEYNYAGSLYLFTGIGL